MSNSKFIQKWFESAKRPIGFSFGSFATMLCDLERIDYLVSKGIFRKESLLEIKKNYLRRYE